MVGWGWGLQRQQDGEEWIRQAQRVGMSGQILQALGGDGDEFDIYSKCSANHGEFNAGEKYDFTNTAGLLNKYHDDKCIEGLYVIIQTNILCTCYDADIPSVCLLES